MANCTIDSGHDYHNQQYVFRVDVTISEAEMKDFDIDHLKRLSMALESDAKVSMKLAVMADLFKQLGR